MRTTLTLGQLLGHCIAALEAGSDPNMVVILRVDANDDSVLAVGGAYDVNVDPGCTEVDAFVIDGAGDTVDPPNAPKEPT